MSLKRLSKRPAGARRLAGVAVWALLSVAPALVSLPAAAMAQIAPKDGQIIGRILTFVEHSGPGEAELGIVYAPAIAASVQEAHELARVIGDGLPAGRVLLRARLIPLDEVNRVSGVAGLFITSALGAAADAALQVARQLRVPTISHDLACVREARCLVGFTTEPTVQIAISNRSADQSGVSFTPAFRMLVKQF